MRGDRLIHEPLLRQLVADVVVEHGVVRLDSEGFPVLRQRLIQELLVRQLSRECDVESSVVRVGSQTFPVRRQHPSLPAESCDTELPIQG